MWYIKFITDENKVMGIKQTDTADIRCRNVYELRNECWTRKAIIFAGGNSYII